MQIDKSVLGGLLIVGLLSGQSESLASQEKWIRGVAPSDLCVTEGSVTEAMDHRLAIDAPKMRAYLMKNTPQSIEAHFTYRGPSSESVPLGSGELRRQFGFKLRAQDPCDLVYAMWRIQPDSKLVVSVKSNPAQHTSSECGNRGYRNVKGSQTAALPVLIAGQSHTLRAEMIGSQPGKSFCRQQACLERGRGV